MRKKHLRQRKHPLEKTLFEVQTQLGFPVRTSAGYWKIITTIKHPSNAGKESDVKHCLANPDEIRLSKRDKRVYLFYRCHKNRYLCVVVKQKGRSGFIVTAYSTDKIKEGELQWKK